MQFNRGTQLDIPLRMTDHTAIVIWLVVTGVTSLTQTVVLISVVIVANRRWQQAQATMKTLERDHLVPLVSRLELTLVDVQDAVARARRAEEDVRRLTTEAADLATTVARRAQTAFWPVWGLIQSVRAAASVLTAPRPSNAHVAQAMDDDTTARLAFHGGNRHVHH